MHSKLLYPNLWLDEITHYKHTKSNTTQILYEMFKNYSFKVNVQAKKSSFSFTFSPPPHHHPQGEEKRERKNWILPLEHWALINNTYIVRTKSVSKSTILCQIKWLNIFLVRSFSYCQINLTWKANLFKHFTWKIFLIHLEMVKRSKKWNYNVEI